MATATTSSTASTTGEASTATPRRNTISLAAETGSEANESFEIEPREIEYGKKIGKGVYGTVYVGKVRGKEVAIKKLKKQDLDEETLQDFKSEVSIMCRIRHPNLLLFMGACTEPGEMAIVTEYLANDNVEKLLKNHAIPLTLYQRMKFAKDAALGINWLHCSNPQIVHRDIKPANLLLDKSMNVRVCDFGFATVKPKGEKLDNSEGTPGSPIWMSPEGLMGKPVDEKSDVYSFGIVLWELATRQAPFAEFKSLREFLQAVVLNHKRPPIPDGTNPTLAALIRSAWAPDPKDRPSFKEILIKLDQIIIEVAIPDTNGRLLWSTRFYGKTQVKWHKFAAAFWAMCKAEEMDVNSRGYICLKALLAESFQDPSKEQPTEIVTLENFGNFLGWFGPILTGDDKAYKDRGVLAKIITLCQKQWFHGNVAKNDIPLLLAGKKENTFFIRLSTFEQGCYTISKVGKDNNISHQRLRYDVKTGFFEILVQDKLRRYQTLEDLIRECKKELGLKHSAEGSKLYRLMQVKDAVASTTSAYTDGYTG